MSVRHATSPKSRQTWPKHRTSGRICIDQPSLTKPSLAEVGRRANLAALGGIRLGSVKFGSMSTDFGLVSADDDRRRPEFAQSSLRFGQAWPNLGANQPCLTKCWSPRTHFGPNTAKFGLASTKVGRTRAEHGPPNLVVPWPNEPVDARNSKFCLSPPDHMCSRHQVFYPPARRNSSRDRADGEGGLNRASLRQWLLPRRVTCTKQRTRRS